MDAYIGEYSANPILFLGQGDLMCILLHCNGPEKENPSFIFHFRIEEFIAQKYSYWSMDIHS